MTCSDSSADRPQRAASRGGRRAPHAASAARTSAGQLERDEEPRAHAAGRDAARSASSRRTRCIATVVERSRTSKRPPGRRSARVSARAVGPGDREADEPDRLVLACRRPGPAMPVTPTPTSAPQRATARRRPAPRRPRSRPRRARAISAGVDARQRAPWPSFGVDDEPAQRRTPRSPAQLGQPPGEQPAGARLGRRDRPARARAAASATCSSTERAVVAEQRVGVALAHERREAPRRRRCAGGLVARDDLDLAAAQAGRDLQRVEVDAVGLARGAASRRSPTRGCRTAAASRWR